MPAIWNPAFRSRFYARWGRESAVICARARRVEYPEYRQLLSIKAAFGGAEDYFLDGRRIAVDDDTFAIFNAGRSYASRIEAAAPVHSFSVFFEAGMLEQVRRSMSATTTQLLADPAGAGAGAGAGAPEVAERVYEHDQLVSPVLRHIRDAVAAGVDDEAWLEEQLQLLLERMLRLHDRQLSGAAALSASRPATRAELWRRLGRGVDFMHAHYSEPLRLRDVAAAAQLSPFHFLRTFRAAYGISPNSYLNRKRAAAARRLLQSSDWSMTMVALQVGFGSRSNLYRHLRASPHGG